MKAVSWDEFFNIVQKNSELKGKCEALAAEYGYAVVELKPLTDDEIAPINGGTIAIGKRSEGIPRDVVNIV